MGAWRRSHDAILVHRHTKDYDKFSQSQRQIRIACPRGWQRIKDRPEQGYLATCSRRTHAAPTIADVYIQDRTAQTISYELTSTFRKTVAEIHREAADNIGLKVIGHSVHYYNGAAFAGLPFGEVGRFGALVRTESLAMSDEQVLDANGTDRPPDLSPAGTTAWTTAYPPEFRAALAPRAGYQFRSVALYTPGYYIASERRAPTTFSKEQTSRAFFSSSAIRPALTRTWNTRGRTWSCPRR